MKPLTRVFLFSGSETIDPTVDAVSDGLKFEFNKYQFMIWVDKVQAVTGNPTYTLEVSHDDIEYKEYVPKARNVSFDDTLEKNYFPYMYMRIKHIANDASAGELRYIISQKIR